MALKTSRDVKVRDCRCGCKDAQAEQRSEHLKRRAARQERKAPQPGAAERRKTTIFVPTIRATTGNHCQRTLRRIRKRNKRLAVEEQ